MFKHYLERRWICWIANRPILNNAQDPATRTGAAITSRRVSIMIILYINFISLSREVTANDYNYNLIKFKPIFKFY